MSSERMNAQINQIYFSKVRSTIHGICKHFIIKDYRSSLLHYNRDNLEPLVGRHIFYYKYFTQITARDYNVLVSTVKLLQFS